ncbi:cytochrome b5-like heme/Steroid binding domain-containing protein [Ditylenchus destructor]|nr:cytochrome b5-like heme/Steroid binding domain-containing protein [Ditylenchus destructor]
MSGSNETETKDLTKEFTRSEVGEHNSKTDLWIIYRGKVYDMTEYLNRHPGGEAMLRQAGKDVSCVLSKVQAHGFSWTFIEKKLAEHCIGKIKMW